MNHNTPTSALSRYRSSLYSCFVRSADALINLNDALLSDTGAQSFVELSQSPFLGRTWSSLYSACKRGTFDVGALRQLRVKHAPIPPVGTGKRLVLVGDASSIARPSSPTARDRTFVHQSNLPAGTKPVRPGWQFSFLVIPPLPPEVISSWVYTLDARRITSDQTPCQVMSEQLASILPLLPVLPSAVTAGPIDAGPIDRDTSCPFRPLFLGDGGYGNVGFLAQTAPLPCDSLVRLAKNRVLYRPKPDRPAKPGRGRPPEDGARFSCQAAATQGARDDYWTGEDEKGKRVEVERWNDLHFKEQRNLPVSVLRVTRHGALDTKRDPKVCWFLFQGQDCPVLADISALYARRYCIEHGFRFKKQDLMWEKTHLRTPERFAFWTDLVCCVENQLFLARQEGLAKRQSWESDRRPLSPQQVRRGMSTILSHLGTPARLTQSRGNSPGRSFGAQVTPAKRYAIVCKATPEAVN